MNSVDVERVLALHPDIVIGNTPGEAPLLADLQRAGLHVENVPTETLDDEFAAIERLGVLTDRKTEAHAFAADLRGRLDRLAARAQRLHTLRAYVAVERSPLYTAASNSFIGALLKLANLTDIVPPSASPFPIFSPETLVAEQPDVIVTASPAEPFTGAPWEQLNAVRAKHVAVVPRDLLNRAGPRIVDALQSLIDSVAPWR